ncbi:hypothetical protein TIFTF001_018198 [Ficus carica]|uniref:Uncharacterized protein n=1 Tax=Ficus carica TaxID=3494 RepID=A0AA88D7Q6_FICCA|nr:hypothetical protein TIFTF001_018198 [Ficus carica]
MPCPFRLRSSVQNPRVDTTLPCQLGVAFEEWGGTWERGGQWRQRLQVGGCGA